MKSFRTVFISFLVLLLFSDIVYSFYQHLQMPLDGDIAESVVPADFVYKVLKDPFGVNVLLNKESYPNPNRFFSHGSMLIYLREAPKYLQHFVSPIESVYMSCALIKIATQCLLILLLSVMICHIQEKNSWESLVLSAVIITPLFQTAGYNRYMGVIDQSVTYTFFYAWPFMLLLLFSLPVYFYMNKSTAYSISTGWKVLMIALAVLLPFSSPLLPGVVVVLSMLFFAASIINYSNFSWEKITTKTVLRPIQEIPSFILFILLFISALSLYSLYIGSFNSSNGLETISITERYFKLPRGIFRILTQKPGWLMLLSVVIVNTCILLKCRPDLKNNKVFAILKGILLFSLIYILMLPLGGFREYRSNIIRYDTFLPVTLGFIFYFGFSTTLLLYNQTLKFRKIYMVFIAFILLAFTSADKIKSNGNKCEKLALKKLASEKNEPVKLDAGCTVLSWRIISDYRDSERNAALLKIWGITKQPVRYYQK